MAEQKPGGTGSSGGTGGSGQKTLEMRVAELEDRLSKMSATGGQAAVRPCDVPIVPCFCVFCMMAAPCQQQCSAAAPSGEQGEAAAAPGQQAATTQQCVQACTVQPGIQPIINQCIIWHCIIRCIIRDCIFECGGGCLPGGGVTGGGFGSFGT